MDLKDNGIRASTGTFFSLDRPVGNHNDDLPRAYRDDPSALWRQPETWFGFAMVAVLLVLGVFVAHSVRAGADHGRELIRKDCRKRREVAPLSRNAYSVVLGGG